MPCFGQTVSGTKSFGQTEAIISWDGYPAGVMKSDFSNMYFSLPVALAGRLYPQCAATRSYWIISAFESYSAFELYSYSGNTGTPFYRYILLLKRISAVETWGWLKRGDCFWQCNGQIPFCAVWVAHWHVCVHSIWRPQMEEGGRGDVSCNDADAKRW